MFWRVGEGKEDGRGNGEGGDGKIVSILGCALQNAQVCSLHRGVTMDKKLKHPNTLKNE